MKVKFIGALIGLSCLKLLAYCEPVITLAQHYPFQPANNTAVNFRISASSVTGISKIIFTLNALECIRNADGTHGTAPRPGGQPIVITINYPNARLAVDTIITLAAGFPAHTYLSYQWEAMDNAGAASRKVRGQAGDSPYGNEEVLLYATGEDQPKGAYHICFVPDIRDYAGPLIKFLKDLETTVYKGYLTNNMIRGYEEKWAFYYTPSRADFIQKDIPEAVASSSLLDAFGFIHIRDYRDARNGKCFSSEYNMVGTIVHETGHAIFNLSDEYSPSNVLPNSCHIYKNKADCIAANSGQGCSVIRTKWFGKYYSTEPLSPNCIMNNDGNALMMEFQSRCRECIKAAYAQLELRAHGAPAFSKFPLAFSTDDRVLVLKISFNSKGWAAAVTGLKAGKSSLAIGVQKSVMVNVLDASGRKLYEIGLDDPRIDEIDDQGKYDQVANHKKMAQRYLMLPYDLRIKTVEIASKTLKNTQQVKRVAVGKQVAKLL